MPTQMCFGSAMQPWPSLSGVTAAEWVRELMNIKAARTSVETAANGRYDNLDGIEATHPIQDGPILVVYCMDSVHMNEGSDREKDGGTDRLKQVKLGATLRQC